MSHDQEMLVTVLSIEINPETLKCLVNCIGYFGGHYTDCPFKTPVELKELQKNKVKVGNRYEGLFVFDSQNEPDDDDPERFEVGDNECIVYWDKPVKESSYWDD